MDTNPVDGGCLCGDVRYQLAGKVTRGGLCHCGNCRRAGGAPSVAWVLVAPGGLAFTHGEPTIYAYTRGDGVPTRRGFCGRCGTQLTYGSDGDYFSKPNAEDIFDAVYAIFNEVEPDAYPDLYR